MQSRHFDAIILGQGLAGTTLAWTLKQRGLHTLTIDNGTQDTASRISAGLITPITGPKLAKAWCWDECWLRAVAFYQNIESLTGTRFFEIEPAVHLFQNEAEQARFQQRMKTEDFRNLAKPINSSEYSEQLTAAWGGFEMPITGRLNVPLYLEISRQMFRDRGEFLQENVDVEHDIQLADQGVKLDRFDVTAERLIFCQGFTPEKQRWFEKVRFNPAKGEILTLAIPELKFTKTVHCGVWLAASSTGTFQLGSTFDWNQLDTTPTPTARSELLDRLARWLPWPVEVTGQRAAIRPTMHDFKPMIGQHPDTRQIGILNGLGTRGALIAPWLAEMLVNQMQHATPLPRELDVQRWFL